MEEEKEEITGNQSNFVENDGEDIYSSKRPKFEHKTKVTNNENFLKLVFAK